MADYKLSHTAAEIDDKLSKIQDGGTGYTEGETIHPIDPKYLPGVCLPVVELSTPIAPDVTLTEAESAALTAVAKKKQCPIMRFQFIGVDFVTVSTFIYQFGEYGFIAQAAQFGFQFIRADSDSSWSVMVTGIE